VLGAVALIVAACTGGATPAASPGASAGASAAPSGAASAPASEEPLGGEVTVLATWTDAEEESFRAMIQPWLDQHGTQLNYTGQRDLAAALTAAIAAGTLPDVAGLPGPGAMQLYYEDGVLLPLDFVDFATYESQVPFAALGQAPDGTLIGIFTKGAIKGLVWYNTATWEGSENDIATLDSLNEYARGAVTGDQQQWCIGVESGGDSGWPGTDWIEAILLRQAGTEVYDGWVAGTTKWTDPAIKTAWETFGDAVANSHGGSDFIVTTNFGKAANPMFADPPGCLLHHQASFITDFFANEAGATPEDYGFFRFPDIDPANAGATTGGGDIFGMFNDTPQARSLIQYMLTADAQQIWVERGGFISANNTVPLEAYPDDISRASAEILSNAEVFRFDGGDLMPAAMGAAFFDAVVEYVTNPDDLDAILANLDEIQADAYSQ
jgi:alpha-glucoside transport system substrate-binding protein